MQQASSAFAGVAFHCYAGDFVNQASFTGPYPNKEVYFTECTGTVGSDWWSDIKWNMDHLWVHATIVRPPKFAKFVQKKVLSEARNIALALSFFGILRPTRMDPLACLERILVPQAAGNVLWFNLEWCSR
jgi:hypothetical protein